MSIHKEFYREIITRENENGAGVDAIASSSFILSKWPIEELARNPTQWIIRNYKADSWISDDLWNDDWVFVIKSGFCVVAKVSSYNYRSHPYLCNFSFNVNYDFR